jgi:hypothetical protein
MLASQVVQKAPLPIFGCTMIDDFSVIAAIGTLPRCLLLTLLAPPLIPKCGFLAFTILKALHRR